MFLLAELVGGGPKEEDYSKFTAFKAGRGSGSLILIASDIMFELDVYADWSKVLHLRSKAGRHVDFKFQGNKKDMKLKVSR